MKAAAIIDDARELGWDGRGHFRVVKIEGTDADGRDASYKVDRNQADTVIDKWIRVDNFCDFEEFAAIQYCRFLWERIDMIDPIARRERKKHGGDKIVGWSVRGDFIHARALARMHRVKKHFKFAYWNIFENVVRWGEPTGIPGSRWSIIHRSSLEAAQHVVRSIAREIYDAGLIEHS